MTIKNLLTKTYELIVGVEVTIKSKEYIKGLYRYPKKMIGRNIMLNKLKKTDVLIFAAHPDDEVLGLSALMQRHREKEDKVTVVYVTNGTARGGASWSKRSKISQQIAATRLKEGIKGLSFANISEQDVLSLGIPDGGTHRYLKEVSMDVRLLIENLEPKLIYTHCIESGHNDHDLVSFVVKTMCNKLKFDNVYEWAEYSSKYPLGTKNMEFELTLLSNSNTIKVDISEKERKLKRKMLASHESQYVESCYIQGEAIRKANLTYYEKELFLYPQFKEKEMKKCIMRYVAYIKKLRIIKSLNDSKLNRNNQKIIEHVLKESETDKVV